jgi:hypothetical protein
MRVGPAQQPDGMEPQLTCACGRAALLCGLFFCSECHELRCGNASCTVQAIEHYYCTKCLQRYTTKSASDEGGYGRRFALPRSHVRCVALSCLC